ncbi:MAG: hypothetical protein A2152_00030 [Candidatus Levybacteria bacterium RBG_16_35_6]|nr:MAG: hypothetical protein A2152_00030 [Candidatus Levybacteria bacterium RBG_16_35_6]
MADIFVAKKKKIELKDELPPIKKEVTPLFETELKQEKKEEKDQRFAHEELFHFRNKEVSLFSSFHLYPSNVFFKEQEEGEEIILLLRKHFMTNFPWIAIAIIITIAPVIFFIFRSYFPVPPLPDKFNVIAFLFYFTVVGAYVYMNFISWFFNISLVTQGRLIDVKFIDIIYHDMAITRLSLVEDISFTQSGFLRSLFNYGDIFVQTAGEKLNFDFLAVPEPDHVLNIIENLMGGQKDVQ